MTEWPWTIVGKTGGDKPTYGMVESFPTKREAVTAMMGKRKLKTPIVRTNRDYTYVINDGK